MFLAVWTATTAAMMAPALVPTLRVVVRLRRSPETFLAGYLSVWAGCGVVGYAVSSALMSHPAAGAAGLAAAGAYQLTPAKHACLRRCRAPLGLVARRTSGFALGVEHGLACAGCCAGLMLALLALGSMSVVWMAVVAAAIFVEKVTPAGARAATPIGLALIALGVWTVLA